ncbi:hypothetical protein ACI2OX_18100 [Bacillus sp. N9]
MKHVVAFDVSMGKSTIVVYDRFQGKNKNHLVEYYDRLKTQPQRKSHKVAVIACMNKFLKVAFHLNQHDLPYDYETATICS